MQIQSGRPPVVLLGGLVLAATVAAGTGVSVWMQRAGGGAALAVAAATLALVAGLMCRRSRDTGHGAVRLASDAAGNWLLQQNDSWRTVSLARVWHGPCWVTLALLPTDGVGKAAILTVWRGAVPALDWRRLCVLLRAGPVRAAHGKRAEAA